MRTRLDYKIKQLKKRKCNIHDIISVDSNTSLIYYTEYESYPYDTKLLRVSNTDCLIPSSLKI